LSPILSPTHSLSPAHPLHLAAEANPSLEHSELRVDRRREGGGCSRPAALPLCFLSEPRSSFASPKRLNLTSPSFASRLAEVDDAIAVDARTPEEHARTPSPCMQEMSPHLPSRTTPRPIPTLG
jgi:hypothetical protein